MIEEGRVYWITGLHATKKASLARLLQKDLEGSILLDPLSLRKVFGAPSSVFNRASLVFRAFMYSRLCDVIAGQGHTVIIATLSLFSEIHTWNRENLSNYVEIFLDTAGGTHEGHESDTVDEMAGSGIDIDFPTAPDLTFSNAISLEDMLKNIHKYTKKSSRHVHNPYGRKR